MSAETSKTELYETLQVGDKVQHPKFGEGQILHRSGTGKDTKFVVSFAEEGEKHLLACYARLKKTHPIGEESSGKSSEVRPKIEEESHPKKTDIEEEELEEEDFEDEDFDEEELEDEDIEEDFEIADDDADDAADAADDLEEE